MSKADQNLYHVSEIGIIYKSCIKASERSQVTCSSDAYNIFRQHWDENKPDFIERAKLLLLTRANRVPGIYQLSSGSTTGTIMDVRTIYAAALKANASSIVLAHNHPSESLLPSAYDKTATEQIRQAGTFLNIAMNDHIIVGRSGYYSFADDETYLVPELMQALAPTPQ